MINFAQRFMFVGKLLHSNSQTTKLKYIPPEISRLPNNSLKHTPIINTTLSQSCNKANMRIPQMHEKLLPLAIFHRSLSFACEWAKGRFLKIMKSNINLCLLGAGWGALWANFRGYPQIISFSYYSDDNAPNKF